MQDYETAFGGPLQQYRHRSLIQQSSALYEKMCKHVANVQEAFRQALYVDQENSSLYLDNNNGHVSATNNDFDMLQYNSSGDGVWQPETNVPGYSVQAPRKSQFSIWRESKMNQVVQQYMASAQTLSSQAMASTPLANPANNFFVFPNIYRPVDPCSNNFRSVYKDHSSKVAKSHENTD